MITSYSTVQYRKNTQIGYFPKFPNNVIHGFSWGFDFPNMQFSTGNREDIISRTDYFLNQLKLPNITKLVVLIPTEDYKNMVINKTLAINIVYTPTGITYNRSSILTNVPGIVIGVRPADCTTTIIYATDNNGTEYTGICHTGRKEVDNNVPRKLIEFMHKFLNITPKNIKLGIVPHLLRENRKFLHMNEFKQKDEWMKYSEIKDGFYYPGETEFATAQYIESGIPEKNIEEYAIDTYNIRYNNIVMSHKYYVENHKNEPNILEGRFLVVTSIKA